MSEAGPPEPQPSAPEPKPELPGARFVFVLGALCALYWVFTLLNQPDPVEVTLRRDAHQTLERVERRATKLAERVPATRLAAEVDDERGLARLAQRSPEAVARARAAHTPMGLPRDDLHQTFASFMQHVVRLDREWGVHLGVHPHPRGATVVGDETRARYLLLVQEAWRTLLAWPGAERLGVHSKIDLALFRAVLETSLRWDLSCRDQDLLRYPEEWFVPLITLATVECCPAPQRLAVVISRLKAIAPQLKTFAAHLRAPPRPVLETVLRRFTRIRKLLDEVPASWPPSADLEAALTETRAGLKICERQLQAALPRATGKLGVGPTNYAIILTRIAFLDTTPADVMKTALEAFRAARRDLVALRRPASKPGSPARVDSPKLVRSRLAELPQALTRYLPAAPTDDPRTQPKVAPAPALWRDEAGEIFYFPPGALAPACPPTVFVTPDAHAPAGLYDLHLRHALARWVTPGHHLQRTLARASACSLRRVYDCKLYQRGWGAYAEELLHTSGGCPQDSDAKEADSYMQASARLTRAWVTILEVLLHTRAATEEELLTLMRDYEVRPDLDLADLGFRAREAGLASTEFLGLRALRRLIQARRADPAFDLRVFHERYLRAGPVPPDLLASELGQR